MDNSSKSLLTGFHVSGNARRRFNLHDFSFTGSGAVSLEGVYTSRLLADRVNRAAPPMTPPVTAGNVNALSTITGVFRYLFNLYEKTISPHVISNARAWLEKELGHEEFERTCVAFKTTFGVSGVSALDEDLLVREMVMLWLENLNPAASGMVSFFDDMPLRGATAYEKIVSSLHRFFEQQPPIGPRGQSLIDLLQGPARAEPQSLARQLDYIRREWASLLGEHLFRLLSALDLMNEEEKLRMPGPAPPEAMQLDSLEGEPENYSPDKDWMPNLVLIAKNVLVWLWQLSRKYGHPITRLDQIPEEELRLLAERGITGIWLIGVWERSSVSKRIKELTGNPSSTSSAYSIFEYNIASSLGGEEALVALRTKAWMLGIRIGADMVPNHTGIYSRWIVEHPDWFISLPHPPFPSYSFRGENLSPDDRIELFLDDHYYDRSDAAVVFKVVHKSTGDVRYVYHGNDGTVMPWNDTAQLNYLNAAVRTAVRETILHVARLFPIIRFDAAMTLTKLHFQRLWFPEPGSGGAVPSRAEHGMSTRDFTQQMPLEFWREVVDSVATHAPDTLLLAEAFWLTEGYFVRTLGMHRVYNSAFMNMLREEHNAEYRTLVKDTLAFDPEILKRYVNFMNNPDEETAVSQFGKDGKYFGICTMMATMPGLPMIGHGQFEGLEEKYGAEYSQPWWDEEEDGHLVQRHEHEIVPLLRRRYLFSGVQQFALYDLRRTDGSIDENVFAYSNRAGEERSLIVYHNKWGETSGWVRRSVPSLQRRAEGERSLKTVSLLEGLGYEATDGSFLLFRDHVSGLEYIRKSQELAEQGLSIQLGAYSYHVFLQFREVTDDHDHTYARLNTFLGGRGVPSLENARVEMQLKPVHGALSRLLGAVITAARDDEPEPDQVEQSALVMFEQVLAYVGSRVDPASNAHALLRELTHLERVGALREVDDDSREPARFPFVKTCNRDLSPPLVAACVTLRAMGRLWHELEPEEPALRWLDSLRVEPSLVSTMQRLGVSIEHAREAVLLFRVFARFSRDVAALVPSSDALCSFLRTLLTAIETNRFLQVNEHQGVIWFSKERLKTFLCWVGLAVYLETATRQRAALAEQWTELVPRVIALAETAGYRLNTFLDLLAESTPPSD
jgi:glycosidase